MNRVRHMLCAALALSFAAGTAVPLSAAPLPAPVAPKAAIQNGAELLDVQYRRHDDRRFNDRRDRRGWHNGHRGYRHKRPGYRYRNGYWFPPAAFITGAIIGGALNNNRAVAGSSDAHVRWCHNRWRSYRASDNTYQPNNGPRRQCVSPYG